MVLFLLFLEQNMSQQAVSSYIIRNTAVCKFPRNSENNFFFHEMLPRKFFFAKLIKFFQTPQ
jgi:hypothetical protein